MASQLRCTAAAARCGMSLREELPPASDSGRRGRPPLGRLCGDVMVLVLRDAQRSRRARRRERCLRKSGRRGGGEGTERDGAALHWLDQRPASDAQCRASAWRFSPRDARVFPDDSWRPRQREMLPWICHVSVCPVFLLAMAPTGSARLRTLEIPCLPGHKRSACKCPLRVLGRATGLRSRLP